MIKRGLKRASWLWLVAAASCDPSGGKSPLENQTAMESDPAVRSAVRSELRFVDATEASGVDFVNVSGSREKNYILELNGGGVALLDYDGDGRVDVFLVNGSRLPPPHGAGVGASPPTDALYRNLGGLRFENVTRKAGLVESGWGCGVASGDYDNDGDPDLYVTNHGADRLWRNNGDGTFTDVTASSGTGDRRWGSSAAFLDYDRDGHLDLFVVNYLAFDPARVKRRGQDFTCQYRGIPIACGPNGLPPAPCTLYRNRGDGTFEDVSETSRIRAVDSKHASYGLGVTVLDYDSDGWIDLYVANDTRRNLLYRNRGDGTFEDVGLHAGVAFNDEALAQAGMGVDSVFLGGGEREDLFVVNFSEDTNCYYRNEGAGFFTEVTSVLGLAESCHADLGWGTFFLDADLDGDQDLFVANGHVVPEARRIPGTSGYRQRNKLFANDGRGRFVDVSRRAGSGLLVEKSSRGAAFGDLDGDGDPDIVINEIDDQVTILENKTDPGRWLAVRARGTTSSRDGIGAVVTLTTGDRTQRRRIRSGSSYASQSELVARFGLGGAGEIKELRVRWPTGKEEIYAVPEVNRVVEVVEGNGRQE